MILEGYGEALQTRNSELIKAHDEFPTLKGYDLIAIIIMVLFVFHAVGVIYITLWQNG